MNERIAYGVSEVAQILGVSRSWLYRLWQAGDGPPRIRIHGRILVSVNDLRSWLDNNAHKEPPGREQAPS